MSVKSSELDNRERGMVLSDRAEKKKARSSELKEILDRLEAASKLCELDRTGVPMKLMNDPKHRCRDCYTRGFAAAIEAIRDGHFP